MVFNVDAAAVRQLSVCLSVCLGARLHDYWGVTGHAAVPSIRCNDYHLFIFLIHVGVCHLIKSFNAGDLRMIVITACSFHSEDTESIYSDDTVQTVVLEKTVQTPDS